VPTLLEKIEADASARLPLPPNRQPAQELARYKAFLKVETHRLKILHRAGGEGRIICQARAAVLDALLRNLLEAGKSTCGAGQKTPLPALALVAIGGYGRQELNPHSDIDIMFLHDGEVTLKGKHRSCMSALTEGTLLALYDVGLKVGHSVRTVEDCVSVANSDMQSKTSLIEARLITGDAALFERMRTTVVARCVEGFEEAYISARLADQSERHSKYGDSACMQEPNVKNGCGGLRDYQNLLWMAFFKYRVRSLVELEQREWISENERHQLEEAYGFLLRVRNDMHYLANCSMDVLLKRFQPTVGLDLGFTDRSPINRLEQLMQAVYTRMRNVFLITRTVEQRLAILQKPKPRFPWRDLFFPRRRAQAPTLVDGFQFVDGEILPGSTRIFRDQPRRLMRVFLHAQQRGLKLHPDLAQLIRHHLALVDRAFLTDPHVHQTFLEILSQRGNVAPLLRAMHEVGFLGRYLPEFGKLTCLVQHEFFHRYTADEHTLVCVEMLDHVWSAQKPPFLHYTEIFRKLERPHLLYLALLLHDSGKALPHRKQHAGLSAQLAGRVARRLKLDAPATQALQSVIENHLAMIQVALQRDLEDVAIARKFARQVQNHENLDFLILHTFADTMGTRVDLWNDFKETLVWTIYKKTSQVLQGGDEDARAEEKQRETLAQAVRRMTPRAYAEEELQAHFTLLPPRYFQIQPAQDIHTDLTLAHQFMQLQVREEERSLEPVLAWTNAPDRGYAAIRVCTWDRAGLFSKIAGSLTAAELTILSAQIFSRSDGIIFDTFFVQEARTGTLPGREAREKFEQYVKSALTGKMDLDALIARQKVGRPHYLYLDGERIPTVIQFDNSISETHTVIDVETEDRVGLLYFVSHALSELGLNIATAKIRTEKGAAIDSFYVRERDGSKIMAANRLQAIEERLRGVMAKLDA
jgi:[protein-PII] uridylyltransferase